MARRLFAITLGLSLATATVPAQEPPPTPTPTETVPAAPAPTPTVPAVPALTRMQRGAKLFIEPTEFGMALSAALLKKQAPVVAVTDREKADFFVNTSSNERIEKGGERIAKALVFGLFMGSGRHFSATVTITNRDGAVIFGHNSKKENFQSAAENIAKEIKKHIDGK